MNKQSMSIDPSLISSNGGKEGLLQHVVDFFRASNDFNGSNADSLATACGLSSEEVVTVLEDAVKEGSLSLSYGSHTGNAHIKRLPDLTIDEQIERLRPALESSAERVCVYPSAGLIQKATDLAKYDGRPFTKRLALAEAQLVPCFFDLAVLDSYARDPRYRFEFADYEGSTGISSSHYENPETPERDKILLSTFGIGYDSKRRRVVVAYLRYLADLSPEHQQIWNAHVVSGPCTMNSDYARATINGDWPEHHSAYEALLVEQQEINKLCALIGKPMLFRDLYVENRPKEFSSMLRPTKRNFLAFVHLLDKMLSDNINKQFFRGDVVLENVVERKDGTKHTEAKGTITLLADWLDSRYKDRNGNRVGKEIVGVLREVRSLRSSPAHAIGEDEYDETYPGKQDDLVGRAVRTLTKLRLVLSSHPKARSRYEMPDWLDGDRIVFY